MPPATTVSTEARLLLAIQRLDFIEREVEENKQESAAELKRVKDDADAEIRRVRDKADADDKVNKARIAALEAERNKALIWGVLTLGGAVVSLVAWIANKLIGGHIQ